MADVSALTSKVEEMEKEIGMLHSSLETLGVNSKGTTDIFGRKFSVPVDPEHKATQLVLFNFSNPHNRAFHTSWWGFFSSFFSMFAAAPLMAYMKKPSSLNLKKSDIFAGNISAVSSNIVMRVVTGFLCDMFGPRKSLALLLTVTCPPIVGMMFVQDPDAWVACRALIGIGLATFVTSQVWCSQMYNKTVVGLVNATSAGWGNLGGGVTNLLMPYIFLGFYSTLNGSPLERENLAWRMCYLVPLGMHLLGAVGALTGRDLPDGNIKELEASGAKQKSKGGIVLKTGLSNINAWILVLTYGMCFGIELTMNSVAALYFYEYHGQTPQLAGLFASLYGLMNLFARSLGGLLSDWANKRYGMRGRLWACWIVQTLEGVMCMLMATTTLSLDAPYKRPDTMGYTYHANEWWPVNETVIMECGSLQQAPPERLVEMFAGTNNEMDANSLIMMKEPPWNRDGAAANCIQHAGSPGLTVFVMVLFSLCVQAAEGLHYGIVPYVSRPALGIVSGMVGAGGNLGSVIAQWSFFKGQTRTDIGFLNLGAMVIGLTALMFFIYFPDMGSMLTPAGALGSYTPQLWKPPADYRGADSMDFSAVKTDKSKSTTADVVLNKT